MNEENRIDQPRSALEVKVKKIDEQIALLNDLKSQCLTQLKSLPQIRRLSLVGLGLMGIFLKRKKLS